MADLTYQERLDERALKIEDPRLREAALKLLCQECIQEINRLEKVIELNNATMRDAF